MKWAYMKWARVQGTRNWLYYMDSVEMGLIQIRFYNELELIGLSVIGESIPDVLRRARYEVELEMESMIDQAIEFVTVELDSRGA
jgi:hypothetical protein